MENEQNNLIKLINEFNSSDKSLVFNKLDNLNFSNESLIDIILQVNISTLSEHHVFKKLYKNITFIIACIKTDKVIKKESFPIIANNWKLIEIYTKWNKQFCYYILSDEDLLTEVLQVYHTYNITGYYKMIKALLKPDNVQKIDIINRLLLKIDIPTIKIFLTTNNQELKQKLIKRGYRVRCMTNSCKKLNLYDNYDNDFLMMKGILNNFYKKKIIIFNNEKSVSNTISSYEIDDSKLDLLTLLKILYNKSKTYKFKKNVIEYCYLYYGKPFDYNKIIYIYKLDSRQINDILQYYPDFIKYVPDHKITIDSFNFIGELLNYININKLSDDLKVDIFIKLEFQSYPYKQCFINNEILAHKILTKKPTLYYLFDRIKYKQYFIDNISLFNKPYLLSELHYTRPDMEEVYYDQNVIDAIVENGHLLLDNIIYYIKNDLSSALIVCAKNPLLISIFDDNIKKTISTINFE